jgi:hypothetical protein
MRIKNFGPIHRTSLFISVVIIGALFSPQADAATVKVMFTSATGAPVSGTPVVAAGEKINLVLGSFPTGSGLYIYQAVQPVAGSKPTLFNQPGAVWVSASNGATFSPAQVISITIDNGHTWGADCAHQQCGLWVEYDFNKSSDRSEDQFVPFAFSTTATPASTSTPTASLPADVLTVSINGKIAQANVPGTIYYQTPLSFTGTAASGAPVTFKSYTPELCPIVNGVVTALKGSGQCDIAATSSGNTMAAPKTSHFPFNVFPGAQVVKSAFSVKKGKGVRLDAVSNFGEPVIYKSITKKVCAVDSNIVKTIKRGTCTITATAPAGPNYKQLAGKVLIAVK